MRGGRAGVTILLLALAVVYLPLAGHEFITYDDPLYVTDNPQVTAGLSAAGTAWAFTTFRAGNWHPLTWLSHQADVTLFGQRPGAHHLVNLLLHAGSALLLFLLLRALTGTVGRSLAAAAIFALHPAAVEPVAWVAERKEVLALFLGLAALLAWLTWVRGRRRAWYAAALALFALGLMAKPMIVTLPLLMLLLAIWPLGTWRAGRPRPFAGALVLTAPFLLLSAAAGIVTLIAQRSAGALSSLEHFPLDVRTTHALIGYASYVGTFLWPTHLAPFYPMARDAGPAWAIAAALLLLLALTVAALRLGRAAPYLAVGWLWFVVALAPVSGLLQAGVQARADRYLYLPMIGLAVALAWGTAALLQRFAPRAAQPAGAALAVATVAALAAGTSLQLGHWHDSERLYRHAIAVTAGNHVAENNLANLLLKRSDAAGAIAHYRLALQALPGDPLYAFNLGWALEQAGARTEAADAYRRALSADPRMARAHNNLGILLAAAGIYEDAISHFERALALESTNADYGKNLELAKRMRSGQP
jgi:tetratricopeptide (TPR) repeat protein